MRKSGKIEHPLNPSAAISAISGESMTLTEKDNSLLIALVNLLERKLITATTTWTLGVMVAMSISTSKPG
jgi:hypothetical protein